MLCYLQRHTLCVLRQNCLYRGVLLQGNACLRRCDAPQKLCSKAGRGGPSQAAGDDDKGKPIPFSTSKASHKTWTVDRSFGSEYQRPWWKVLPISAICITFLLWCIFRKESDIDAQLDRKLYEHLPALLPESERNEPDVHPKEDS